MTKQNKLTAEKLGESEEQRGGEVVTEDEVVRAEAGGGGEEGGRMFECELCGEKHYAYVHKLKHHQLWSCEGRQSETCMLSSPRRSESQNCLALPPTPSVRKSRDKCSCEDGQSYTKDYKRWKQSTERC